MKTIDRKGPWSTWLFRAPAMVVGVVLVGAALLKATEPQHFLAQMRAYGLVEAPEFLMAGAWALVTAEFTLGWALIISYRPRLTLALTAILLAGFVAVGGYAWVSGVTDDCGCFGSLLKRSPKQGVAEGLVMLSAIIVSMVFRDRAKERQNAFKGWSVTAAFLAGIVLPATMGFLPFQDDLLTPSPGGDVSRPPLQTDTPILQDLSGPRLLILMEADCPSCLEAVGSINDLALDGDMPLVTALAPNDEARRTAFMEAHDTGFLLDGIGEEDFWRLLGPGGTPRTMLVLDGRILRIWDGMVPDREAVLEALEEIER